MGQAVEQWYCLFLTILQNEIHDFSLSFELSTLVCEKVKINIIVKFGIVPLIPVKN